MKTFFLCIGLLSCLLLNAQKTEDYNALIAKSARQRKAGWLYLGFGTGITSLGISLYASASQYTRDRDQQRNQVVGAGVMGIGLANFILGIVSLSSSGKNSRAAAAMEVKMDEVSFARDGLFKTTTYPSLNLKIRLH